MVVVAYFLGRSAKKKHAAKGSAPAVVFFKAVSARKRHAGARNMPSVGHYYGKV